MNECNFKEKSRFGLYLMVWICLLHALDVPIINNDKQEEILQRIQRIEMFHGIDTNMFSIEKE